MAVIAQQPQTRRFAKLRKGIEIGFEWLSIMVIPALFISSVIISLELAPWFANLTIWNFAIGAIAAKVAQITMVVSVESAMVGCSVVAKRAKKEGDEEVRAKYSKFGILFLILFVLSLAALLFPIPDKDTAKIIDAVLTFARCIAAGVYAYACHGDNHEAPMFTPEQVNHLESLTALVQRVNTQVNTFMSQIGQQVNTYQSQVNTSILQLGEQVNVLCEQVNTFGEQQKNVHLQQIDVHQGGVFTCLQDHVDMRLQELRAETFQQIEDLARMMDNLNNGVTQVTRTIKEVKVSVSEVTQRQSLGQAPSRPELVAPRERAPKSTKLIPARTVESGSKPSQIPVLEVESVTPELVHRILTDHLVNGIAWRNISGNYMKSVKPVKDAYELYVSEMSLVNTSQVNTENGPMAVVDATLVNASGEQI